MIDDVVSRFRHMLTWLNSVGWQQKLQVFMQGESIVYREQDTEAAAKYITFFGFGFAYRSSLELQFL
jgi:hypothetical protein